MTAPIDSRILRGLVVSCQPVTGGPMDHPDTIVRLALAARNAGANGLRIEGAANIAAVAAACTLPIVGIVKRDLDDSPVRITPYAEDVANIAKSGATIIAVDATARRRPVAVDVLLREIHAHGCLAMADLATVEEARYAAQIGFDILGTTLSGYTGGPIPDQPDLALVDACLALGKFVIAEGRYSNPALAAKAIARGATAVCVGSAITRTEHITRWYLDAITSAAVLTDPVLAFDVGGTKTLAALVKGGTILEQRMVPTDRRISSSHWFGALGELAAEWSGRYSHVAAAVTGLVANGEWSALNPETLPISRPFSLVDALKAQFGVPALAWNDAQAAAWGEYRFGAGAHRDMIFLTISSGIGGGIVTGGRLWRGSRGLAGSLGQSVRIIGGERLEATASGFGMARAARASGHSADAKDIFAARESGESWAREIVAGAAREMAGALTNLQALIDPEIIILGGGVGRVAAFHEEVVAQLAEADPRLRPHIEQAKLGAVSGLLGVADLAIAGEAAQS
ncbi:MAG: hypothetical protein K0S56_1562 [Microvirga sp.]|jgi:N-acetylmannosamine-6-phosphate 2-epimerase/N-acetylmannosamine kinase|nr:hypothetical protein [Microvirga sp.]